jgi:hypothetical protein
LLEEEDEEEECESDEEGLPVELVGVVRYGLENRLDVGLVGESGVPQPVFQLRHADGHGRTRHEAHNGAVAQELNHKAQPAPEPPRVSTRPEKIERKKD